MPASGAALARQVNVIVVVPATLVPSGARAGVKRNARITSSNFLCVVLVRDLGIDLVPFDPAVHPNPESDAERGAPQLLGRIVEREGEVARLGRARRAALPPPARPGPAARPGSRTDSRPPPPAAPPPVPAPRPVPAGAVSPGVATGTGWVRCRGTAATRLRPADDRIGDGFGSTFGGVTAGGTTASARGAAEAATEGRVIYATRLPPPPPPPPITERRIARASVRLQMPLTVAHQRGRGPARGARSEAAGRRPAARLHAGSRAEGTGVRVDASGSRRAKTQIVATGTPEDDATLR